MNLEAYNPESGRYKGGFLIRKMDIIQIVIKGNQFIPWARSNVIPFLIEQKGQKKKSRLFAQMFHLIRLSHMPYTNISMNMAKSQKRCKMLFYFEKIVKLRSIIKGT